MRACPCSLSQSSNAGLDCLTLLQRSVTPYFFWSTLIYTPIVATAYWALSLFALQVGPRVACCFIVLCSAFLLLCALFLLELQCSLVQPLA